MRKKSKLFTFATAAALFGGYAASAQEPVVPLNSLLSTLVGNKVISENQAEKIRADSEAASPQASAGKIDISTPVKQLKLYGDARVRYEWREGNALGANGGISSDTANADRYRYRLRLGADVTLTDDWFLGIRLETSNDARSTNVTASNSGTGSGQAGVVPAFGKAGTGTGTVVTGVTTTPITEKINGKTVTTGYKVSYTTGPAVTKVDFGSTIFVGQLYVKHKFSDWLTVEAGKIPNPFVTTPLVWDPDINPEGFAEQFKYTVGPFGGAASPVASDGKGDKEVAAHGSPGGLTVDLFANLGQFVYDTASPQNQFGTGATKVGRDDSWLLGWQAGAKVNFDKNLYLQFAPTFYNYTGSKNNDFNTIYSGDAGGNQTGINDLAVIDVPAEVGWKSFGIPFTVFSDWAYNVDSAARATAAGHPGHDNGLAWQAGLSINKIKKRGDWNLAAYYQYSGAYSLDPNLVDNDIFDSHLNMRGVVFKASYALSDAVSLSLQYNYGQIIDKALGTGGSDGNLNGATSSPALRNYSLLQADLNVKF